MSSFVSINDKLRAGIELLSSSGTIDKKQIHLDMALNIIKHVEGILSEYGLDYEDLDAIKSILDSRKEVERIIELKVFW